MSAYDPGWTFLTTCDSMAWLPCLSSGASDRKAHKPFFRHLSTIRASASMASAVSSTVRSEASEIPCRWPS